MGKNEGIAPKPKAVLPKVAGGVKKAKATAQHGLDVINFFTLRNQWGFLTNFFRKGIVVDGKEYKTVEHWFQSQKFLPHDPEVAEEVRSAATPGDAKNIAWRRGSVRPGWHSGVSTAVMKQGLLAKFTQHADLKQKLLDTGNARLVEHTKHDNVWGDGGDGTGENRLGKLLMEVREELRRGQLPQ